MITHFAPAERANADELQKATQAATNNAVVDAVMHSICGLLAVLNSQRQIIAVNDALLEYLGIKDLNDVLGLRPGEAIHCVHSHETAGGCGTTKFCASCGLAIAIVSSLAENKAAEKLCAATIERDGNTIEICFRVRAFPIVIEGYQCIFLFLQDITSEQMWASLETTFFHDINNIINGLVTTADLLSNERAMKLENLPLRVQQLAGRLAREFSIQHALSHSDINYHPDLQPVPVAELLNRLEALFSYHPNARGKHLRVTPVPQSLSINSDITLLERILTNMLLNAFEATEPDGEVRMWVKKGSKTLSFCVWNKKTIPPEIQLRIFQRHFSTKTGKGRGIGTFSMKLFGEKILKGSVDFTSSPEKGTCFCLHLPY